MDRYSADAFITFLTYMSQQPWFAGIFTRCPFWGRTEPSRRFRPARRPPGTHAKTGTGIWMTEPWIAAKSRRQRRPIAAESRWPRRQSAARSNSPPSKRGEMTQSAPPADSLDLQRETSAKRSEPRQSAGGIPRTTRWTLHRVYGVPGNGRRPRPQRLRSVRSSDGRDREPVYESPGVPVTPPGCARIPPHRTLHAVANDGNRAANSLATGSGPFTVGPHRGRPFQGWALLASGKGCLRKAGLAGNPSEVDRAARLREISRGNFSPPWGRTKFYWEILADAPSRRRDVQENHAAYQGTHCCGRTAVGLD